MPPERTDSESAPSPTPTPPLPTPTPPPTTPTPPPRTLRGRWKRARGPTEAVAAIAEDLLKAYDECKQRGVKITHRSLGNEFGVSGGTVGRLIEERQKRIQLEAGLVPTRRARRPPPAPSRVKKKRPRRSATRAIAEDLLKAYDDLVKRGVKVTYRSLGEKFGVSPKTAGRVIQDRGELIELETGIPPAKRVCRRNMQPVEDALMKWIVRQKLLGTGMVGKSLRGKVATIWTEMKPRFHQGSLPQPTRFSSAWLTSFKCNREIEPDNGDMDQYLSAEDVEKEKERNKAISHQLLMFELEDIYACRVTSLYTKPSSSNNNNGNHDNNDPTLHPGPKVDRPTRVSILFCLNTTGTDKRKPLVLCKHNPTRLSIKILDEIDVITTRNGYMQTLVFSKWLRDLDNDMDRQGRRIALLIDTAPYNDNCENLGLRNITIIRLTPSAQPLDAGILQLFKAYYSEEVLQLTVPNRHEGGPAVVAATPARNAIPWPSFARSWNKVTAPFIRSSFRRVPIFIPAVKKDMKRLGIQSIKNQVSAFYDQLINKYTETKNPSLIIPPDEVEVLNYIEMMHSDGPDETMMECIREIMDSNEYKDAFVERNGDKRAEVHAVDEREDEEDEEDNDDEDEDDYDESDWGMEPFPEEFDMPPDTSNNNNDENPATVVGDRGAVEAMTTLSNAKWLLGFDAAMRRGESTEDPGMKARYFDVLRAIDAFREYDDIMRAREQRVIHNGAYADAISTAVHKPEGQEEPEEPKEPKEHEKQEEYRGDDDDDDGEEQEAEQETEAQEVEQEAEVQEVVVEDNEEE